VNYSVVWTPAAEQELAAVWLAASERTAVTAVSYRLDQELSQDPYNVGFDRDLPVNRTATDLPLGIDYEIVEDDKQVRVLRVWSLI
jgi:hypothetical protein